jgi:phospholysine phosphohistidine inorganic pyrophosphate phosphatase
MFTPAPATQRYLTQHSLRPHLLVHKGVEAEFDGVTTENPNCVVMGDAADEFSYANMNKAFLCLMQHPTLITMGNG